MFRRIVYPGQIPLDTDHLDDARQTMIALGYLVQSVMGTDTVCDGLVCSPTGPASMNVEIGPGIITSIDFIDPLGDFGSLPQNTTDPLVKMGIKTQTGTFAITAPGTVGQSINYLIQAKFNELDGDSTVLPYYNASNPAVPYSGPANAGTPQYTERKQNVHLLLKAGVAATTGSQTTPAPDSGFVGLWVIVSHYGDTSITSGRISQYAAAPFIPYKLPQLSPGMSHMAVFSTTGTWTVPFGVALVRARIWGGGGGGGSGGGSSGAAGGGGGGGGYAEGFIDVSPGDVMNVTIGSGGAHTSPGGLSTFAGALALGGGAGLDAVTTTVGTGGAGGTASGLSGILITGGTGQNGMSFAGPGYISGQGGSTFGQAGGPGAATSGNLAGNPPGNSVGGAGASGGVGTGLGATGAVGLIVLEW